MMKQEFDAIKHFDEKVAPVYDERIREIIPGYEVMHDLALYMLEAALPARARVLVAGAGTGHEAIVMAGRRPEWQITGFDPSVRMLALAKAKIDRLNLADKITLLHGAIDILPPESVFDGASSILVTQFLPDNGRKADYLAQIGARLKRGARLVVLDLEGARNSADYKTLLDAWKGQQFFTRLDKEQVERDFRHVETNLDIVPEERLRELLAAAGFRDIIKFYKSLLLGGYVATRS